MSRQSYDLSGTPMTPNTEWKKIAVSLIAAVVFTALCLVSFLPLMA
jgi:hypothetical protein